MAKQQPPFPESLPSTEAAEQTLLREATEPTAEDLANRAAANTALLQEILARSEERGYAKHWGINE